MRTTLLPLLLCGLAAGQTTATKGQILQPSGDATLTNIVIASAVTPGGAFGYTAQIYLVKGDASAPPRKLTSFDESSDAPGATSVAISPDGTRAAYIAVLDTNGVRNEEVHAIDIASGADQLIAVNHGPCSSGHSCLGPITFSQDGTILLWGASQPSDNIIYTANFDGSAVTQLGFHHSSISGPNNVTTLDGRFVFVMYEPAQFAEQAEIAKLDGSGAAVLEDSSNTALGGNLTDEVVSTSGVITAELHIGTTPSLSTPVSWPSVSPGRTCSQGEVLEIALSSLTISSDGSHVAGINNGQIFNCESAVTPLNQLRAFDVQLSGDGSRMIFSAGVNSGRAALWIADASGANTRPIFAPHSINVSGIVGIGSQTKDILPLSPGSYFTIYGANLGNQDILATPAALPFPASLEGVSVDVNGSAVPLQAVTPWQVNALVPQEMAPGTVPVTVHLLDGTTLSQNATIAPTAPAIDLLSIPGPFDAQAAAFHPGTATLADVSHPAVAGEILETYGFGLGPTTPSVAAGAPGPSNPPATAAMPFVNVDAILAQTTFAGLVPGLVGVYQVNVVVPAGLQPGKHFMSWYSYDPAAGQQGAIYTK